LGSITDVECLQQATADQAFTNAQAAGSIDGMVGALVYRSLERNTQGIGTKSNPCTSIKAVNPQIAALSQHQDPASTGAAAANKAVALELAVQIASVGGDPTIAIKSGTFAPGLLTDNTGKGNTCTCLVPLLPPLMKFVLLTLAPQAMMPMTPLDVSSPRISSFPTSLPTRSLPL
jgi:hypothetical protein